MKKKLVAVLMTAAMAATLAACGTEPETENTPADPNVTVAPDGETTDVVVGQGSEDAIANLIAATEGTVDLTLWCSETEAYQNVMAQLVDEFKAEYSDVDFNITIGSQSESTCKDEVLKDVEAAADVYVFADEYIVVKTGNNTTEVPSRMIYQMELIGDMYKIVQYDSYVK